MILTYLKPSYPAILTYLSVALPAAFFCGTQVPIFLLWVKTPEFPFRHGTKRIHGAGIYANIKGVY